MSRRIGVEDEGAFGVESAFRCLPGCGGFGGIRGLLPVLEFAIRRPMRSLEFELGGIGGFGFPPAIFRRSADGLHALDVERWIGRWRDGEDAFPEVVEFEEEFDFLGAQDFVGDLHRGLAPGAKHRVFAPDAQNEVAPEWAEFAIGLLGLGDGVGCGWWFWRSTLGMGALAGDRDRVASLFEPAGFVGVIPK